MLVYFLNNWNFAECIIDVCMTMRLGGPFQEATENWEPSIALQAQGREPHWPWEQPCESPGLGFLLITLTCSSPAVLSITEHRFAFLSSFPFPAGLWIAAASICLFSSFISSLPLFVVRRMTNDRHTVSFWIFLLFILSPKAGIWSPVSNC